LSLTKEHFTVLGRTVLLAVLAIGAAFWGLVRHYTYQPAPMLVPDGTSPASPPTDLPAPELLGTDDAGP
jgi:hypothetical protein